MLEDLLPLVEDSANAGCNATDSTAMLLQRTTGIMVFLYMLTSMDNTFVECVNLIAASYAVLSRCW